MPRFSEPIRFLPVITSLPILFIVANQTVATSLFKAAETTSFKIWLILTVSYLILQRGHYISKIRWFPAQVTLEITLLSAPLAYPIYIVATQKNPYEYESTFLAYLTLVLVVALYLLGRGKSLGSVGKIGAFLFAYIFALMIYAGSVAGQQIGVPFLLTVAFDQLIRVAILAGYPAYMVSPPSAIYVRASMILAIPTIIFLALSAELAKSEAKNTLHKGSVNLTSDLRPAILLLTFAGVLALALTLPLSLWFGTLNMQAVTLIPTLGLALLVMLLILISERRR